MLKNAFYFFRQAFWGLQEHRVLALLTVLSISLTFLFSGFFYLVYINLEKVGGKVRGKVSMMVYIHDDLSSKEVNLLMEKLQKEVGVGRVTYFSKEQALQEYLNDLNGDPKLIEGLGENPFPASFRLMIQKTFQTTAHMNKMKDRIELWSGIEEIQYQNEWISLLNRVINFLKFGGIWLGGLLILGILAIVSTTIRLTVYERREEIQILKFMGATNRFILAPFFVEGLLMGVVGSIFALFLLTVLFDLFGYWVGGGLPVSMQWGLVFIPKETMVVMLALGVLLGCLGSLISVKGVLRENF